MNNSKAEKKKKINEKTMIVSLDIGKKVHYCYFRTLSGIEVRPFSVLNDSYSFKSLWVKICQFAAKHRLEEIVMGFESTGSYALPLVHYFSKKPLRLVQVNPYHCKRMREVQGNSPNKTDKKDPRVVADIILLNNFLTVIIPEGMEAELRELTGNRERSVKNRTSMLNQLQDIIYCIFPEFLQIMKTITTKTSLYLIAHSITPESITSLGLESLGDVMKKLSRGRMKRDLAVKLFQAAQTSIGIKEGVQSKLLEIRHLLAEIATENQFIEELVSKMEEYLAQIPYSKFILSIKGLGIVTVAGLIGEFGDLRKFDTCGEVIKMAGLNLYEVSSGDHKGQRRISKRGRSLIRKFLYYASLRIVNAHGMMREKYQQLLNRGMVKMKALTCIMRKLLRTIFALVRDGSRYKDTQGEFIDYKLAA